MNKTLAILGICTATLLAAPAGAQEPAAKPAPAVSAEQVSGAIRRGLGRLRQLVRAKPRRGHSMLTSGERSLAALAMLHVGVPAGDPQLAGLIAEVARHPHKYVYVVSLKCQVLSLAGPKYGKQLQSAANWLIEAQLNNGMWSYRGGGNRRRQRGDNSNTQFALLGLHEAAKAGAEVPRGVWLRSARHFNNTQLPDGGWTYVFTRRGRLGSYGSMTAAGVASLYVCGQRLFVGQPAVFRDGVYLGCGNYHRHEGIAKGLEWLGKRFTVTENPGRRTSWLYYYLYALERVGMVSGRQFIGRFDWYREGAAYLVQQQRAADDSWNGSLRDTAFALLYLAKGNRPVLFQKVHWRGAKNPHEWNRNVHDLENLTNFIGEKFGKAVTWQTTPLDVSVQKLRLSPVLLITGHEFPEFNADQRQKLRDYVEAGGVLLFEACCGAEGFREGFRKFAKTLYAEVGREYRLRKLTAEHPVFDSYYALEDTYGLEGIDIGCKTGIFFSPNALSGLWELGDWVDRASGEKLSENALKLGTNIAAYATGREQLPDKLAAASREVAKDSADPAEQIKEVPRGAVRIARLVHGGDYNSDPHCMVNLAALLRAQAGVDVVAKAKHVRPDEATIYQYPVVFMHGHRAFRYSEEQLAALRDYLARGGFLFADSCCGREEFDKAFRQMADALFEGQELQKLPADHAIYTGAAGVKLGRLKYRAVLTRELAKAGRRDSKGTAQPPLYGLIHKGRTVLVYSPFDFTCALEGDNPYACRGYVDADGKKLALAIVLFAIAY